MRSWIWIFGLFAGQVMAAENTSSWLDEVKSTYQHGSASWQLTIENDSLLLQNSDRFYTSGAEIGQKWLQADASQSRLVGWRLGQQQYTASDIKLYPSQIAPNDHPYAAWLYAGAFVENHQATGATTVLGLDLGCLGPCAGGKWSQDSLHKVLNQPLPEAWNTQMRNEVGAILYGQWQPLRYELSKNWDVAPQLSGRFGNIHTDASAAVLLRAGQLNALPHQDSLYTYLRVEARAVAYDASLQGGYFSKDNPRTVQPKRTVGDLELGLVWNRKPYSVSASVVRRSNEIRDLPNSAGMQNFARLQFQYAM